MDDYSKSKEQLILEIQDYRKRYKSITDAVTDYFFTVYIENGEVVETVHGAACIAVTGYSSDEFKENPYLWINMVHDNDRDKVSQHAAGIISNLASEPIEHRIVRKNGEIRWVRNTPVIHLDAQGNLISYDGLIRDITEQKTTEHSLRKSEARYRAIVQDQPEFIVRWRPDGIRTFVNERYCQFLGKSYDELVGETIFLTINEEDQGKFLKNINNLTPQHDFCSEENRLLHPDGSVRIIQWTDRGIFNDAEELIEIQSVGREVTEQKQAELALQESEEKFRTLAEESPNMIFINQKGKVVYVNKKCEELGYSRQEFYDPDFNFLSIISLESIELIKKNFQRHLQDEDIPPYEYSLIRKNGTKLEAIITTKLIPYQGVKAILGIVTDISEQKQIREALIKSEAFYREVIENAAGVPFRLIFGSELGNGFYDYIGDGIEKLFGVTAEEFSEKIFNDHTIRINPRLPDMPSDPQKCRELMKQGKLKRYQVDIQVKTKTGKIKWLYDSSLPLLDEKSGDVIGSFGILLDITERKLAEKAIRDSEEKYRYLIQYSNDAIYLLYNRKFELINPKFQEMLGFTLDEVNKPNFDFIQLVAPKSRAMIEDRVRRVANGEKLSSEYEFTAISKYGREIDVEASVTYIKYKESIATQGILRDITERKKLEEQLRQAQKMEAVGRLAGGVSHDFNNLLTAITGYTQLLLSDVDYNDKIYSDLNEIKKAADRAASLTHQLLAFSRKQILQPQVLDINSIIIELDKMLRRMIGEDIELVTILGSDIGYILADQSQIEQVIMNLAVNSRDAMPTGGKLILETQVVTLDEDIKKNDFVAKAGSYVTLSVIDNGTGMSEETQSHLYEPFYTTKDVGKGTGLGLSTVYGIVRQSNGFIDIQSKLGEGTTIKIYFAHLAKELNKDNEAKKLEESLSGTETILLVEDEDIVRRLTRKILTGFGYNILEASYGEDAIRIVNEFLDPIHLILTDVVMPKMSGVTMVEKIKKKLPDVKTLYISGYTEETIDRHGKFDAAISFLQKPFTPLHLAKEVRKILDQ